VVNWFCGVFLSEDKQCGKKKIKQTLCEMKVFFSLLLGSYQPSIEMMLRFYAYFKQATEGPCTTKKPLKIWLEQRAKWDAWNKLGKMPKEVAMENYVEELKKVSPTDRQQKVKISS
jgi:acyl-CoA-binding protein